MHTHAMREPRRYADAHALRRNPEGRQPRACTALEFHACTRVRTQTAHRPPHYASARARSAHSPTGVPRLGRPQTTLGPLTLHCSAMQELYASEGIVWSAECARADSHNAAAARIAALAAVFDVLDDECRLAAGLSGCSNDARLVDAKADACAWNRTRACVRAFVLGLEHPVTHPRPFTCAQPPDR